MYEVIKTDKERFAIREVGSQGIWILGTNIVVDSDSSNIAVFKDKRLAYKEAIRLNCIDSKVFAQYINVSEEEIEEEIRKQNEIMKTAKNSIEILQMVLELRNSKERNK